MPTKVLERRPTADENDERSALSKAALLLGQKGKTAGSVSLRVNDQSVTLPASAVSQLYRVISRLAQGKQVAVLSPQETLTTQEAADLLHVSRPYLVSLLDKGEMPYQRLRSHRRIRLQDLLVFQERFDAKRKAALDRLAQLSQEAGLYDDDEE